MVCIRAILVDRKVDAVKIYIQLGYIHIELKLTCISYLIYYIYFKKIITKTTCISWMIFEDICSLRNTFLYVTKFCSIIDELSGTLLELEKLSMQQNTNIDNFWIMI